MKKTINQLMGNKFTDKQAQAMQLGYQMYQTYKDDSEFQRMLELDKKILTLYNYGWGFVNNVNDVIKEGLMQPDLESNKRKKLQAALAHQEEVIAACIHKIPILQAEIQPLCEKFGYPFTRKQVKYTP